ncbi:MAG: VanZ family protein [Cyclobacteriaceae bacterium]
MWLTLITSALLAPAGNEPYFEFLKWPYVDKIVHLGCFTILAFLMAGATKMWLSKKWWIIVSVGSFYGLLIEWLQIAIPGRSFEWQDWVADTMGAVIGCFAFMLLYQRKG